MRKLFSACSIGAVVALSGCASIVSDSSYPVNITSSPEQAGFEVVNSKGVTIQQGTTPEVVTLKSGTGYFGSETYTIKFQKEGYEEKTFTLDTSMDGWYVGNIVFGGLIGFLIVDPITGAMWKLPETATVSLSESQNSVAEEDAAPESIESADSATESEEQEQAAEEAAAGDTLSFITIDQVPAELRSELVRVN